jgi:putative flippase GtrA
MKPLKQVITPQVIRWIAVGVVFAGIGLVLIKLLAGVLAWPYALATLLSGEICTILRFLAVDSWVFSHKRPTFKKLWQYHVATALGFAVWWSAANLLKFFGVQYLVAAVLAMFFSVGFNMFSNFLWIWRKPAGENLIKKPNQLPDPTSPSVAPPASAGAAPSIAADH